MPQTLGRLQHTLIIRFVVAGWLQLHTKLVTQTAYFNLCDATLKLKLKPKYLNKDLPKR